MRAKKRLLTASAAYRARYRYFVKRLTKIWVGQPEAFIARGAHNRAISCCTSGDSRWFGDPSSRWHK